MIIKDNCWQWILGFMSSLTAVLYIHFNQFVLNLVILKAALGALNLNGYR